MKTNHSRRNSRSARRSQTQALPFQNNKAALYIRASTEDQKLTLEGQDHEGRLIAKSRGIDIDPDSSFIEPGISASKPFLKRPVARKTLAHMKKNGISTLFVINLNRGFRDVDDMRQTVEYLVDQGMALRIGDPDIDARGGYGKFLATVLTAVDELYLSTTKDQQRRAFEVMRRRQVSRSQFAPFGWDLGEEIPDEKSKSGRPYRRLVPNEREQAILREIISRHEQGETLQSIADRLNSDNIPTKRAGAEMKRTVGKGTPKEHVKTIICSGTWAPQTVASVLDYAELPET